MQPALVPAARFAGWGDAVHAGEPRSRESVASVAEGNWRRLAPSARTWQHPASQE